MEKTKPQNKLECKDGRYFENGRFLPKKDYILHFSSNDVTNVVSCRTGQKYRTNQIIFS